MDSLSIAQKIEELQPQPTLHLDSDYIARTQQAVLKVLAELAPIAMPRIPGTLLNPPSAEYFEETRARRFGMPLAELARSEKARNAWQNAQPVLQEIAKLLRENDKGPYVLGDEPSFADFILAGFWRFMELLDQNGDLYGRIVQVDSSFSEHYEACKKWMERDN